MSTPTLGGWLMHVMKEADGALSLEEALHIIMDSMKEYYPCQSVAVIFIDDDTKELRIKISRNISYTFAKQYHRDSPSDTIEKIVLGLEPALFNGLDPESDLYRELKLEHDFVSAVVAPVVLNQRGTGFIFCDRTDEEPFTDSDKLHLQVVGYLIGNLMEKYELLKVRKQLSQYDDASGALQYKAFVPAFARELERARSHDYGVILALIAVDAFRKYVETYGIDPAHALLHEVVDISKEFIEDVDILARFGADEFILCLSGVSDEEADKRLNAIHNAIAENAIGQGDITVSITIGAISLSTEADKKKNLQDIMADVGKCLVRAKGKGGGDICFCHGEE